MNDLIEILSHPYLVLNAIARDTYEGETPDNPDTEAFNQRLRSRVKGRHRFSAEEYKTLRRLLIAFSRKLDRYADKLEAQSAPDTPAADLTRLFQHPWLNHKEILEGLGARSGLNYYQLYDRLRSRVKADAQASRDLATELRRFAAWVRERLEQAHEARKTYVFSNGRGKASHKGPEIVKKGQATRP
ncbi:MAG: hypothetical protein SF053_20405 [Bacteroidia bacterium]|nr:hypothetical protein [Bacteroidia bacterium]